MLKPDEPKKPKPPRFGRKRKRVTPRRMRWFVPPPSRDIDLMKPEYISGPFCGCGGRESDGVCWKCLNVTEELFT